jgi:hypothetical protein
MASSSLTCADSIKLFDNLAVIADPVSVGEPRPSALAREALLTEYASAHVSHVRWTGSAAARRPCAVPVLARGTGGTTGTAARAETRCGRRHIASQRFCVVLSILGASAERAQWLSVAPSGPQWPSAVTASPRPTRYVLRSQAFSPCRGSDPGIRDSGHRRREPAPVERVVAAARCRVSPDPHRLARAANRSNRDPRQGVERTLA